jgi:RimJ/RimL family protein N-acetyltransferase
MATDPVSFSLFVDEGLTLSALCPGDKPALIEYLNEKEIHDRTLRIPFPYTEADADFFLHLDAKATQKHGHLVHFAIRDAFGKAIGGAGFEDLVYGHRAEIGYWLAKPFWGRGIMTKVVRTLCDYAFSEWNLIRITAHVFPFNAGSRACSKRTASIWKASSASITKKADIFWMRSCMRW